MWGYNTNMGQFGGPMTPRMNMGGGPRGFSPWMQGIPNGFTPPNFANNMGEVFGGMPGGGGPMQFNMGAQLGKMPGQMRPPMPDMSGATNRKMEIPPHIAQILGYTKPTNDIGRESPPSKGNNGWLNNMLRSNPYMGGMNRGPQSMGMGGGYLNDVYNLRAKSGGNFGLGGQMDMTNGGVLSGFMNMANAQPNSRMTDGAGGPAPGQRVVQDMMLRSPFPPTNIPGMQGGFNPRMMGNFAADGVGSGSRMMMGGGMGMGMGLGMGMSNGLLGPGPSTPGVDVNSPQAKAGQQAMLSYLQSRFTPDQLSRMMMQGGGGMGNPNAPYSTNPNHMVYM